MAPCYHHRGVLAYPRAIRSLDHLVQYAAASLFASVLFGNLEWIFHGTTLSQKAWTQAEAAAMVAAGRAFPGCVAVWMPGYRLLAQLHALINNINTVLSLETSSIHSGQFRFSKHSFQET
jgi:hypothetical protein